MARHGVQEGDGGDGLVGLSVHLAQIQSQLGRRLVHGLVGEPLGQWLVLGGEGRLSHSGTVGHVGPEVVEQSVVVLDYLPLDGASPHPGESEDQDRRAESHGVTE